MSELGKFAARRKWLDGLSWAEVQYEAAHDDRFKDIEELGWHKVRDHARAYREANPDDFPGKPGVTIKETNENVRDVHYLGIVLSSADELLEYIGYNPDEWIIVQKEGGYHQGQSKREVGKLEFDDGRITGSLTKGGVNVTGMISLRVRIVRRHPVAIEPVIVPVVSSTVYKPAPSQNKAGILRELFLPDPHFGFTRRLYDAKLDPMHDRGALDIALQIAVAAKADGVTWGGDDLDNGEWSSSYTKLPEFQQTTQPALLESHWHKAQFVQALPEAHHRLMAGNHDETRIIEAMLNHLPAAYGLQSADNYKLDAPDVMSLRSLLGLDSLGIEYIGGYPDAVVWLNERVALEHGANSRLQAGDYVTVCGHYHRREWISKTRWGASGAVIAESFCPGMLGRLDRLPGKTSRQNWQQGIALIDYDPNGTWYQITPIPIENGRAIWNKQLFTARDRVDELRSTYRGWNW